MQLEIIFLLGEGKGMDKVNGGTVEKVESCSRVKDENGKLVVEEDEV